MADYEVNLYARYEARLLSGQSFKPTIIPAVIITGFLGSGKTTLVQHVLRNRGALRIAVLINEVGRVDVDSELVNAKQSNAALGLPATDLSGGCICCSRSEDLAAALRRLRAPPAAAGPGGGGGATAADAAPCDYLLVETSGAADAGPLAEALVEAGFRLDAVVAVVDAEAGPEALKHPVARAQVCCSDVVVLNKCDLVAGGTGSGLGAMSDLEDALSDMAPGVRVVRARYGEVPLTTVLDVVPVEAAAAAAQAPAAAATSAATNAAGGGGGGGGEGFMSHESMPSITTTGGGYRLATALLRSKGVLWFGERRAQRFTFHLSGRRRVELSQEGPWEGPPSCSIVFIGTDAAAMAALRQRFEQEVLGADNTMVAEAEAEVETGAEAVVEADPEAQAAVAVLGECIAANDKMELLPAAPAARPTSGINGEELNAELVRRANADGSGLLLLAAVTAPGSISAVTGVQARDRVQSLLVAAVATPAAAQQQAEALMAAAEPILRKAWGHVHNCKCDVAGAVQALQR
eukprot:XP_001703275.1 predicted protein [Chlamydomonas reinhardtii]